MRCLSGLLRGLIPLPKPPPNLRVSAERRPFHHDVAGALEVANQPLCDDVRHKRIGVMLALATLEPQGESERCGEVVGIGGR
jgi:hypothetical protein